MKRALTIILFAFLGATLFGQTRMQFRDPFWVDTTSADFHGIVKLWNDYKNSLVSEQSPTAFWMESEVATYGNPDLLIQSFTLSKYDFMDFMGGKELFIGVEKRNDTLFEMRTMLFSNFPTDNQLTGVFTYPVVKVAENEYRFYSKLSLLKPDMKSYQVGWVTYFYPYNYPFDKEAADQTYAVANEFAAAMGLEKPKPVEYYLFNDRTEYFRYLGADVSCYDFIGCGRVYPHGFAFADCNKVFFTKGGESLAHEIMHFIIKEKTGRKRAPMFEEGVCSYYGGHTLQPKETIMSELKKWLMENPQIDLGVDLVMAYKDQDGRFVTDSTMAASQERFAYGDYANNYAYAIQMAVCEMAERKGGKALVIKMLNEIKENEEEYNVIKNYLGIARKDMNRAIREFVIENY